MYYERAVPLTRPLSLSTFPSQIEAKDEAILDTKKEIKQLKKEVKASSDSKLEKYVEGLLS